MATTYAPSLPPGSVPQRRPPLAAPAGLNTDETNLGEKSFSSMNTLHVVLLMKPAEWYWQKYGVLLGMDVDVAGIF